MPLFTFLLSGRTLSARNVLFSCLLLLLQVVQHNARKQRDHINLNTVRELKGESKDTWKVKITVFGLELVHRVYLVVIIQLGRKKYINNNSVKTILQHTPTIHNKKRKTKVIVSVKNKTVTAAMIHRLSSGHMFTWSSDLEEIISTNQWSVWDSSLCKRQEKILHSRHMGITTRRVSRPDIQTRWIWTHLAACSDMDLAAFHIQQWVTCSDSF